MTRRSIEPSDDDRGADWPAGPWQRALLGIVAAVLLLATHALPHFA